MITEIVPGLWLGTVYDAIHGHDSWDLIINVNEHGSLDDHEWNDLLCQNRRMLIAPFCDYTKAGPNLENTKAKKYILDYIANVIHMNRDFDKSTLVHCAAGVERSPLAVIYYLWKCYFGKSQTPREVFEFVKQKRPIIEDRLDWVNWEE